MHDLLSRKILQSWEIPKILDWTADSGKITVKYGSLLQNHQSVFTASTARDKEFCFIMDIFSEIK